jgi:hypothetical protein
VIVGCEPGDAQQQLLISSPDPLRSVPERPCSDLAQTLLQGEHTAALVEIEGKSRQAQICTAWLHFGSKKEGKIRTGLWSYVSQNQQIALGEASPEKAGVAGSTPSLATI